MNSLFAAMQQDTAVRKLQECFGGAPAETLVYGLSGPAKHVAFASCFCKYPQPVVILVHSRDAAREWKEDLEVLLPDRTVMELPELDPGGVQAEARSMESTARRMNVLGHLMRREPVIVLASSAAAVQKGMSRQEFERLSLAVRIGQQLPREQLIHQLVHLGYEHAD